MADFIMSKLKCIGLDLVLCLVVVCFLTEPALAGKPRNENPPGAQNDVHGPNPGIAADDGNAVGQAVIVGDPWGEGPPGGGWGNSHLTRFQNWGLTAMVIG
jgi:hypothetical protein